MLTARQRKWAMPSYAALMFAMVFALAAPALTERVQWVPFLLSLVLFGMAHGAVDHHVPARLLGRVLSSRERVLLVAGYAAASVLLMLLWWIAPLAALTLFLLVATLHWGDGDLWFCESVNGRSPPTSWVSLALFILARGLLPIGLPLLAHPASTLPVLNDIVGLFGDGAPIGLSTSARVAGLCIVGSAVLGAALWSIRDNAGQPARVAAVDIGELALLAVFFLLTPPVFAVGVYFLVWHSPRHILRLMVSEPRQRALLESGRSAAALLAFHREALLFTVVPLIGITAIAVALAVTGASQIAAISLAAIAALTYPHALVVAWMDWHQGVWRARHGERSPRITTTESGA